MFVTILAAIVAFGLVVRGRLEIARLSRELKKSRAECRTCDLTGLPNRRSLKEEGAKLVREALRGSPLTLLFMDLDEFGKVNKQCGELAGDQVLQALARGFRGRESDLWHPYGDNFAVIFKGSPHDLASALSGRINAALKAANAVHVCNMESKERFLTPVPGVSIAAAWIQPSDDPATFLYHLGWWNEADKLFAQIRCEPFLLHRTQDQSQFLLDRMITESRGEGLDAAKRARGRR